MTYINVYLSARCLWSVINSL